MEGDASFPVSSVDWSVGTVCTIITSYSVSIAYVCGRPRILLWTLRSSDLILTILVASRYVVHSFARETPHSGTLTRPPAYRTWERTVTQRKVHDNAHQEGTLLQSPVS